MNTSSTTRRAALGAALCLATLGLAGHSAPAPDGNLTVSLSPNIYPAAPGDTVALVACGNPGDYVLFMSDTVLGPSTLPYVGGIDIGLAQSPTFARLFRRLDANGKASVACTVNCDDLEFFGVDFNVQAVSLNPSTREFCVSNIEQVRWDIDSTCGDGCTPGYWKQPQHEDSWPAPYTPTTLFSDVFEDALGAKTLLEALEEGGGALDALGRHAVAGLLNAASPDVDYPLSVNEVIDAFNDVYPGTDEEYEDLKDDLESYNELGCALN